MRLLQSTRRALLKHSAGGACRIARLPESDRLAHAAAFSTAASQRRADLVIFDKDGTLMDFGAAWTPWVKELTARYVQASGKPLCDDLYRLLGYDAVSDRWKPGLVLDRNEDIHAGLKRFLVQSGCGVQEAERIVKEQWHDPDFSEPSLVKPIDDPRGIMQELKCNNIKVGVCTSDARVSSESSLQSLGVSDMVDLMMCGTDADMKNKPDPRNIQLICDRLGVEPTRTVYVGDSHDDVAMGKRAGVWATIGVLSGVGCRADLAMADYVYPSLRYVLPLVLPHLSMLPENS